MKIQVIMSETDKQKSQSYKITIPSIKCIKHSKQFPYKVDYSSRIRMVNMLFGLSSIQIATLKCNLTLKKQHVYKTISMTTDPIHLLDWMQSIQTFQLFVYIQPPSVARGTELQNPKETSHPAILHTTKSRRRNRFSSMDGKGNTRQQIKAQNSQGVAGMWKKGAFWASLLFCHTKMELTDQAQWE